MKELKISDIDLHNLYILCWKLRKNNRFVESLKLLAPGIDVFPDDKYLLNEMGLTLIGLNRLKEASYIFLRLEKTKELFVWSRKCLADIYADEQKYKEAFYHYDLCIDELGFEPLFINNYAYTLYEFGNKEDALEMLEMANIIDPDSEPIKENLKILRGEAFEVYYFAEYTDLKGYELELGKIVVDIDSVKDDDDWFPYFFLENNEKIITILENNYQLNELRKNNESILKYIKKGLIIKSKCNGVESKLIYIDPNNNNLYHGRMSTLKFFGIDAKPKKNEI